jgi:septal ring factor EnvC (AmiA/AmiB activator)
VAALFVELTRIVAGHDDQLDDQRRQLDEHRQYVRQVLARMEQHDARFEQQNAEIAELRRDIRRILDAMERRGGDGSSRES